MQYIIDLYQRLYKRPDDGLKFEPKHVVANELIKETELCEIDVLYIYIYIYIYIYVNI